MRDRLWAIGLILFGLGLLAAAAWQYFGPEDGPGLIVDEPERAVSGCSVGQTKAITFSFHNRSRRPVQVIGLAPC
ncbi:MAG TPA: hypothetical protein VMF69_01535 [Gemmataceae bacterium]|nr:hypothetical protein [Gemmataceae bacterium]